MTGLLLVRNGIVLAGRELEPVEGAELRIRNGRIVGLARPAAANGGHVVDARGGFVLPGLVDAHVHLDLTGAADPLRHWRQPPAVRGLTLFANGIRALAAGITAVRDTGSVDHSTVHYARLVASGRLLGPRVRAPGRMLMMTGGHVWEYGREVDGPDDVRRAAREQLRAGATMIKLMASAGFSTPGNPEAAELTVEELRAGVEEAHRVGAPAAAHAHAAAGIANALAAGVDSIEHGAFIEDVHIEEMARRGVPLVPTLRAVAVVEPGRGIDEEVVEKTLPRRDRYYDSIRRAHAGGVTIAAGTDAGTALNPIGGLVAELELYVDLGVLRADALRAATVDAGPLVEDRLGTLEPEAPADVIVVEGDPREDFAVLRRPRAVIARGRPVDLEWARETIRALDGQA